MASRFRSISLASPLVRGAIAALLLAAIAGSIALVRARDGDGEDTLIFDVPTPVATAEPEAGIGPLDNRRPVQGEPAPDFVLRDLNGTAVRLSDLRGKVVFVNFWATWCRPCKQELPDIQKVAGQYPDDLAVLAINVEESQEEAAAYFVENGLSIPALLDRNGGVFEQYGLRGLPDSFFIDREGNVAVIAYGYLTEEMMRDRLGRAGLE
jgi:thiol-disulfide isomerase/thioredoxin